jgi:NADH dehydrogenase/NADH:ubiquinone oxidoreductase subunit G
VEADGGSKLLAACANSVWEGANIVTNNEHVFSVRKTIIEMILADHPQDCLSCRRNKSCELQTLAINHGIFSSPFENEAGKNQRITENETIVRDMDKCVKCSRCIEVCQEIQTIRALNTSCRSHEYEICTAYKQPLKDVTCVFCGGCSAVCPVGAIYEYDHTDIVRNAIHDSNIKTIAQVLPSIVSFLEREFAVPAGAITMGKIITAIKMLGFDKVYDASVAANAVSSAISGEVQARKNSSGKLPVISGCSEGITRFVKNFYPDLAANLTTGKNIRQQFASSVKNEASKVVSVSLAPCISQKYAAEFNKTDLALTAAELARMIKVAGIIIEALPEEKFDVFAGTPPKQDSSVKKETVHGYAAARKIMEAIQKGECDALWVEVLSCPSGHCAEKC